ncbi:hypothetical protein COU88_03200 [Candidatus Roizmanbacteria bacterium CG10_big_fil_rev_8_21_14_0_10_39_6]|uniref:Uncharacterized protein n=1 Tax=Candidatus Roizmanbacteria bacterium CG10_big_fil_rev_8_21_14_0_10_39_6 TaxID=1974853 RepID=A0A2M8KS88_9BACT|nr:MAG: hypothetical protein COU88_03200 [Candidatus Roizmanbacteria bacterium CG10_big_fil_rev_8_21_14_0_10_39_6]
MIHKFRNIFLKIGKRKRFALSCAVLSVYLFVITYLPYHTALFHIIPLLLLTYTVTYIGILEDIEGIEWIQLFILPLSLTVIALLFYYLLPVRLLTRIPFVFLYSVILYAIFLSENIFNVGVEKTLALYRAAYSVANFIILLILLLMFTILFSFGLNYLLASFIGMLAAFPLFFHSLWIANPMSVLEERIYKMSALLSVFLGFGVIFASFLPLRTTIYAILNVAMAYFLIGVSQEIIQDTVYLNRIKEYVVVYGILIVFIVLSMQF